MATRNEIAGPFGAAGNWYRGCLHSHTSESDGSATPDRLVDHYRRGGYDFIALTDHDKLTDRTGLSRPDFLVLPGTELAVGHSELGERFHVVGVGIREPVDRSAARGMSASDAIAEIRRLGGEAIVAHPYWSGLTVGDLLGLSDYVAVEVYNTTCQTSIGRGLSAYAWDEALTRGRLIRVVASDDCHRPGRDTLGAWTMVRAPELSAGAILEALRQGSFYASTGPEIYSVALRGNYVEVECSPAQTIELICDPTRGARLQAGATEGAVLATRKRPHHRQEGVVDGELVTGATFELAREPRYARVQVTDPAGRVAWTNPLFMVS